MKKMLKVLLVLMTVVSIAGCSSKTTTEKATKKTKTLSGNYQVEIKVKDYGTIYAEIDADTAPITVTNFVKLSKEKFYDGLTFHRIIDGFMIQGGDPKGDGTGGSKETIKALKKEVSLFELESKENVQALDVCLNSKIKRALVIPSEVSYNAKTFNLKESNFEYDGALQILAHIVRYDYLWNKVRVLGGAYGCTMQVSNVTKEITLGSFRDPNCKNTYDVYDNLVKYLTDFNPSKEEFNSYLIGAIGAYDQPASNSVLINNADSNFICGITDEDRVKTKKEMINTTVDKIKSYAKLFELFATNGSCYTIGNQNAIEAAHIFDEIKEL